MVLKLSVTDALPAGACRSARQSECSDIVAQARSAAPHYLRVTGETHDDFQRFYKSMIQYRRRHQLRDTVKMRKLGDELYLWVETAA